MPCLPKYLTQVAAAAMRSVWVCDSHCRALILCYRDRAVSFAVQMYCKSKVSPTPSFQKESVFK